MFFSSVIMAVMIWRRCVSNLVERLRITFMPDRMERWPTSLILVWLEIVDAVYLIL